MSVCGSEISANCTTSAGSFSCAQTSWLNLTCFRQPRRLKVLYFPRVVPTMLLLRLPAVIFESHLLDFLPAGAGWALIAAAHFTEIDDRTITSYVNARGSQLLQMMEAILRDGLTVPVFEYRHVPTVLLSCPWRRPPASARAFGCLRLLYIGVAPAARNLVC